MSVLMVDKIEMPSTIETIPVFYKGIKTSFPTRRMVPESLVVCTLADTYFDWAQDIGLPNNPIPGVGAMSSQFKKKMFIGLRGSKKIHCLQGAFISRIEHSELTVMLTISFDYLYEDYRMSRDLLMWPDK